MWASPAATATVARSPSSDRRAEARHEPQRTCVGCRRVAPQRELLRITRTPEGMPRRDGARRRPGRGAYLCRDERCWQQALRNPGPLSRAFRAPVGAAACAALLAHLREHDADTSNAATTAREEQAI